MIKFSARRGGFQRSASSGAPHMLWTLRHFNAWFQTKVSFAGLGQGVCLYMHTDAVMRWCFLVCGLCYIHRR